MFGGADEPEASAFCDGLRRWRWPSHGFCRRRGDLEMVLPAGVRYRKVRGAIWPQFAGDRLSGQ
eukprot:3269449-Lingulodinium_polyedra.AAC.1